MMLNCNVIDVGARYGLHPTWRSLYDVVNFHLIEMDVAEAERLERIYDNYSNIKVYATALFSSNCKIRYRIRKHRGLNSLFDNNYNFRKSKKFMVKESIVESEEEVFARTIDSLFESEEIHFLKVDAEGAELEVLKGAEAKLNSTVLGVRAEVYFAEVYKDIPFFGEIHSFMRDHDFELINLDYDGRGHCLSKFTLPHKYGQLMGTEAVWIKDVEEIFKQNKEKLMQNAVLLSLFLLNNKATDIAMNIMLRAIEEKKISFINLKDDPIFLKLKRTVAFLFKDMLLLPSTDEEEIYITYTKLFGVEFPTGNNFYETFPL